jgi:pyruvate dehydrogenase E1 component alpha subunit
MAALWKLPIVYVCENNRYTEYTPFEEVLAGELRDRPAAFGLPVEEVDGQDLRAVFPAAEALVRRARRGEGPGFLICHTYRYYGHHVGDINRVYYRSKEEEDTWKAERDPLRICADWLGAEYALPGAIFDEIRGRVSEEIRLGLEFAFQAPFPEPDEVDENVYA